MKINHDFAKVLRAGYYIEKHAYRKEQEAGLVLGICVGIAALMIILVGVLK